MRKILALSFLAAILVIHGAVLMPATASADTVTTVTAGNTKSDAIDLCKGASGFVTLSCIPGFADATQQGGLTAFFNLLYRLCIGAAVVIAVLQITRAGITYMGSDSFTEKKDARNLINASLLGLVLIMSPVLVFSIINPNIIKTLSIDTSGLTVTNNGSTSVNNGGVGTTTVDTGATAGNQPVAGCNAVVNGTYAKKGICDSSQTAGNFSAGCSSVGLKAVAGACVKDSQDSCIKDFIVYCEKMTTFVHYQEKRSTFGVYTEMGIIPKQQADADNFQSTCTASGGNVSKQSSSFWDFGVGYTCPADAGFTVNPPYTDSRCKDDLWQCVPPL